MFILAVALLAKCCCTSGLRAAACCAAFSRDVAVWWRLSQTRTRGSMSTAVLSVHEASERWRACPVRPQEPSPPRERPSSPLAARCSRS